MKAPSWTTLIGAVLVLSVLAVGLLGYRLGAFQPVKVWRDNEPGRRVVAKELLGPYIGIAAVIKEVEDWAKSVGEPCTVAIGRYMDDPELVDEDRLHSAGGCVLSGNAVDLAIAAGKMPSSFKVFSFEIGDAMLAEFTGAPSIGPWKVYPKLKQAIADANLAVVGPAIEFYEITGPTTGITRYALPVRAK